MVSTPLFFNYRRQPLTPRSHDERLTFKSLWSATSRQKESPDFGWVAPVGTEGSHEDRKEDCSADFRPNRTIKCYR